MSLVIRRGWGMDARSLAPRLRPEDAEEMSLVVGHSRHEETLLESIEGSKEVWVGEEDGVVIALGGISLANVGSIRLGVPWLVGSPEMLKYPKTLVNVGRGWVSRWMQHCDQLTNYAHAENTVHLRWLKHIGFTLMDPKPWGACGAPFIQFYKVS